MRPTSLLLSGARFVVSIRFEFLIGFFLKKIIVSFMFFFFNNLLVSFKKKGMGRARFYAFSCPVNGKKSHV